MPYTIVNVSHCPVIRVAVTRIDSPENMTNRHKVGPMLGRRRKRWANSGPTLVQCSVFAGSASKIAHKFLIGIRYIVLVQCSVFAGSASKIAHKFLIGIRYIVLVNQQIEEKIFIIINLH